MVRSNLERKRWKSSVRSYLCGDEFNSVLAEEDSASARRRQEGLSLMECKEEFAVGAESKRSESVGTSIEVQTGNSTLHSFQEENESLPQQVQHKGRTNQFL
ncbi:hypothetical protein AgCh_007757 [Apium graveolens]